MKDLQHLLRYPEAATGLTDVRWNDIINQARKAQLLGQLAARLDLSGVYESLSPAVRRHLDLARLTSIRRGQSALWEISTLRRALEPGIPLVLLKGCAYVLAGDANAPGRFFSDIDILIPRSKLDRAESQLVADGWKPGKMSEADQRYYREWMHELPPMEHVRRHTTLDLHHAIIPPVSRYSFPTDLLLDEMEEVRPGIYVLGKMDRVIHCAVHLIQEGESRKITRDLYDLALLLEQHFDTPASLQGLLARAESLGLKRLVAAAIDASKSIFNQQPLQHDNPSWLSQVLSTLGKQASESTSTSAYVAEQYLYLHSHWMKLPARLLIPHLLRKSLVRLRTENTNETIGRVA